MSYQLEQERTGKIPKIEMPPLPAEQATKPAENTQDLQIHPEIAKELAPEPAVESQEASEPQIEAQEVVAPEPVVEEKPLETPNSKNIRFLREKAQRAEQAERERDALLQRLAQVESNKTNIQPQQTESETNLDPEDFVNAKHLNKYDKKIAQLQEELHQYKQQVNVSSVDVQLKQRFPDIDKVLTKDNIEMLKQEYPEIAASINANPDFYSKGVSAYTMIKKLGINTEDIYQDEKAKIQKNAVKPKPTASIAPTQGDSPLSKASAFANGLTDDLKKSLWQEMQKAKNNF